MIPRLRRGLLFPLVMMVNKSGGFSFFVGSYSEPMFHIELKTLTLLRKRKKQKKNLKPKRKQVSQLNSISHCYVLDNEYLKPNWDESVDRFDDMGLKEEVLRGIYGYGFNKPSPIQQKGILPVIQGHDTIA